MQYSSNFLLNFFLHFLQLVESEMVAENCKSRCEEQGIPFYCFSPHLKEVVAAGETDVTKLLDMIIQTKIETSEQGLQELIDLFFVSEASKALIIQEERINTLIKIIMRNKFIRF